MITDKDYVLETSYMGQEYRSRLEARWAVFFTHAGLDFEYEKEGFKLPSGRCYLPDFYLPDLDAWVEIKGKSPVEEEIVKCQELSRIVTGSVYLFFGKIHKGMTGFLCDNKHVVSRYAFRENEDDGHIYLSNMDFSRFDFSLKIAAAIYAAQNARFDGPHHIKDGMIAFASNFRNRLLSEDTGQ